MRIMVEEFVISDLEYIPSVDYVNNKEPLLSGFVEFGEKFLTRYGASLHEAFPSDSALFSSPAEAQESVGLFRNYMINIHSNHGHVAYVCLSKTSAVLDLLEAAFVAEYLLYKLKFGSKAIQ